MTTARCEQCQLPFTPNSARNRFCSRECQVDSYRGRSTSESKKRKETGFMWDPVRVARPVKVTVPKAKPIKRDRLTALVLPDPQFGYRWLDDGTLEPFHDDAALSIALQIAEVERPDLTIWLGDFLDLAPLGRYRKEEGLARTVQAAIDRGYEELAAHRALCGEMRLIEGNHDARLHLAVIDNLVAASGLRRAARPHEFPALSVPSLLRLEDLDTKYVGAYPAGATYINDNLACIHGRKLDIGQVLNDERTSLIQGHIHRIDIRYSTRNTREEPKFTVAMSPGTLARIDGSVPSMRGGVDLYGKSVRSWENWQQGVLVVRYEPGDGLFDLEMVPIFNGRAYHMGREYRA